MKEENHIPKKGDHCYIECPGFTHHGIYCGFYLSEHWFIHYDGKNASSEVEIATLGKFAKGKKIHIKEYSTCYSPDEVVKRAVSRLGEKDYHAIFNNCEHFSRWCKTGDHKCKQVRNGVCFGAGQAANGLAIAAAIKTTQELAKKMGREAAEKALQVLNPVQKILIRTGLKELPPITNVVVKGSKAFQVVGITSRATSAATGWVIDEIYKDDQALPSNEQEARKSAKEAGKIALTAGEITGIVIATIAGGPAAIAIGAAIPVMSGITTAVIIHKNKKEKQISELNRQ
ncbi:MAG: lecithin retinol acyltransferase family protein [Chloroflexaceae bacterium]|nr:lecithin retinol acyltransferase family protein [Chloroflexaceae bacterium]